MDILDSNLTIIPQGNGLDYSLQARERTRFLRFTLTVHPHLITPGATNIDPQSFPLPTPVTVYVRALLNNRFLTLAITKDLLALYPKMLLMIYTQGQQAFDIVIKERNTSAPDPDRFQTWLLEIKAKTRLFALKYYTPESYVGQLEGTKTLAQRLVATKQQHCDSTDGKLTNISVQELLQDYQFLLSEIIPNTPPTEIPQLDQLFVQVVSKDLRTKLLSHLQQGLTTSNEDNIHRFNRTVMLAIDAERELKTVTTIAERVVQHRQTRSAA
jgi:hypothetical protein